MTEPFRPMNKYQIETIIRIVDILRFPSIKNEMDKKFKFYYHNEVSRILKYTNELLIEIAGFVYGVDDWDWIIEQISELEIESEKVKKEFERINSIIG